MCPLKAGTALIMSFAPPARCPSLTATSRCIRKAKTPPTPTVALSVPLVAADLQRAARIEIAFAARPFGAKDDKNAVQLREDVQLRNANPNAARPDPTCT